MTACTRCETDNRDGARFCKECGAPLAPIESPIVVTPAVPGTGETSGESIEATDTTFVPSPASKETPVASSSPVISDLLVGDETSPDAQTGAAGLVTTVGLQPQAGIDLAETEAQADLPAAERKQDTLEQRLTTAHDMSMANESLAEAQPAPLSILSALTLPAAIAGRYELTEVIEQTGAMIVYRAHDRMRCGQCSTLRADMSDPYCIECGAEIGSGAPCRVQAGDIPPDAPQEHLLTENDATYWILPEPVATPTQALASKGLHLRVGYASDSGMVRDLDEDSLLVVTGLAMVEGITQPSLGLFAVADGMGGHENGQVASRRVIQVLSELLMPRLFAPTLSGETILPETSKGQVRDAIQEANRRLTLEAREADSDMGSTLTLAWVRDGTTLIANVGDSRTYLWHGGALDQVTQDHSMVALQIAEEKIDKNAIYTHPRRNEIYRVMGDKPDIEVDVFQRDLQPGDRLVLCCDGVWEMIHDEGIEEVLLAYPDNPQAACDEMVKQANTAGGEDNISVIVVDMH